MIGTSAAALLMASLVQVEGKKNVGYLDIAGIPTACMGDTVDVVVGKFYSDQECYARLDAQASAHMRDALRATPQIAGHDSVEVAVGLFTYNAGGPTYAKSTAAKYFRAGQLRAGCDALTLYTKARVKGVMQTVNGLVNRRTFEHKICISGIK